MRLFAITVGQVSGVTGVTHVSCVFTRGLFFNKTANANLSWPYYCIPLLHMIMVLFYIPNSNHESRCSPDTKSKCVFVQPQNIVKIIWSKQIDIQSTPTAMVQHAYTMYGEVHTSNIKLPLCTCRANGIARYSFLLISYAHIFLVNETECSQCKFVRFIFVFYLSRMSYG